MKGGTGALMYQAVEGWGKLPNGWRLVDVGGVAVDSQDRVHVLHRGEHSVIIFDRDGSFAASWGDGEFTNAHGLCIGPDA